MTKLSSSLILVLLMLIVVFGWLIADDDYITKDSILYPRYVAECLNRNMTHDGMLVNVEGYVKNITVKGKLALIRGRDNYLLKLSYNETSLAPGDEIVAYGRYNSDLNLFIAEKIYRFRHIFKMRYFSSLILLPFLILIFFREYRFKDFKFVKKRKNGLD